MHCPLTFDFTSKRNFVFVVAAHNLQLQRRTCIGLGQPNQELLLKQQYLILLATWGSYYQLSRSPHLTYHRIKLGWQKIAYLHIQQAWSTVSIHLESCLLLPDECRTNIESPFIYLFHLHQLLREISVS